MKRIGTILVALFFMLISSVSAIGLLDISDNPNRYLFVNSDQLGDMYIDSYSIKEVSQRGPFCAISIDRYWVANSDDSILKTNVIYIYDVENTDAVMMYMASGEVFDYDGYVKEEQFPINMQKFFERGQISYNVAEFAFYKVYNQFYDQEFSIESLGALI